MNEPITGSGIQGDHGTMYPWCLKLEVWITHIRTTDLKHVDCSVWDHPYRYPVGMRRIEKV